MKKKMKVIGITKNDCITGIQYGVIEITVDVLPIKTVNTAKIKTAHTQAQAIQKLKAAKFRRNNTKHK